MPSLAKSERIKALFILDSEGQRICAKFYAGNFKTIAEQEALEKMLPRSAEPGSEADILMIENHVVVFRNGGSGVMFYVVGSDTENELILTAVLNAAFDSLSTLLRDQLDRRMLLDNFELVLLTLDEIVDDGVILEVDEKAVRNRVLMKGATAENDTAVGDMTIAEAVEKAKEQASKGGFFSMFKK